MANSVEYENSVYRQEDSREDDDDTDDQTEIISQPDTNSARNIVLRFFQWRKAKEVAKRLKQVRIQEQRAVARMERAADDESRIRKIKRMLKRNRNRYENTKQEVQNIEQLDELK